ncbi:glycosyltransferase family 2 protein [Bradyrhizobium sp. TZ2]
MRIGLVIATHKRASLVGELLNSIQGQSRLPDEVVLSAVEPSDIPEIPALGFPVKVLLGQAGSCKQRNTGIEYLAGRVDIIVFLDDDFWMAISYLEELDRLFASDSAIVGTTGKVIADGATSAGFSVRQAEELLRNYQARYGRERSVIVDVPGAYGCNMAFRMRCIDAIRFDERLPLYGWQEDVDFSAQVRKFGRLVRADATRGIHLGTKVGKTSGLRFGYSQVINPLYVYKKGNMSLFAAGSLILRNLLANTIKSVLPEPYIDRRGRLQGNLIGLAHVLHGRLDPIYVLQI